MAADLAAVFTFPFPDFFDEFFALVVEAVFAFGFFELGFHLGLGGDASVVHARQPEHFEALHAFAACDCVHEGVVERVPHVQLAGDVGWRQDDGKRRFLRRRVCCEVALVYPVFVEFGFNGGWFPRLRQIHTTIIMLAVCVEICLVDVGHFCAELVGVSGP